MLVLVDLGTKSLLYRLLQISTYTNNLHKQVNENSEQVNENSEQRRAIIKYRTE